MLTAVLAVLWWTLSGHAAPLMLGFGAISLIVTLGLSWRMRLIDREGAPYDAPQRRIPYLLWLLGEVVKANIQVARLVLRPDLDITPRLVRLKAAPRSALGVAALANSITLTPGTLAMEVRDGEILAHALDGSMADVEACARMGARAAHAYDVRAPK